MVYGLNVAPVHGYYVDVAVLDGSLERIELVDPTPDGGYTPQGLYSGRHIKTANLPKQMKWLDKNGHPVPDLDRQHALNVSERAKALIEKFEMGVHQFIPVEYLDINGKHLEDRFFLVVGNRIDGLDHDKTTLILVQGKIWRPAADLVNRPELIPPGSDVRAEPKIVFSTYKIGRAHIWCDKHLSGGSVFISDELAEAILTAGLTGVDPTRGESVA